MLDKGSAAPSPYETMGGLGAGIADDACVMFIEWHAGPSADWTNACRLLQDDKLSGMAEAQLIAHVTFDTKYAPHNQCIPANAI